VLDFHVAPDRIVDLYETIAGGYAAGLRNAGWDGTDATVRLGMSAPIAAKYAWILPAMLRGALEHREILNRRPIEDTFRHWAPAIPFLLDLHLTAPVLGADAIAGGGKADVAGRVDLAGHRRHGRGWPRWAWLAAALDPGGLLVNLALRR